MEVVGAIIIAIVLTLIFYFALSARGPWGSLWSFFLIILLIVWSASLWISPIGPVYWGVAWIPLIFIGIIFALLLAAIPTSETDYRGVRGDVVDADVRTEPERAEERAAAGAVGFMFWIFIFFLIIAIIAGYAIDTATVYTS